jgi:hypothetical protein
MTATPRSLRPVAALLAAALLLAAPGSARADGFRVSASAGAGSNFSQTYFTLGGTVGYGLGFGLELSLGGSYWLGATPAIFKLAPGLTWHMPLPLVRPYVGAFYDHWFVGGGFPDQNGIGARAGLTLMSLGPASVGAGVAYERLLSCSANCDVWWPEANASFSF